MKKGERITTQKRKRIFLFNNFSFYNLKYPEFVWSYGAPAPSFGIECYLRVETASIIQLSCLNSHTNRFIPNLGLS